jgi:hypothetical protein
MLVKHMSLYGWFMLYSHYITFEKHVTSVDISCSTMKKTLMLGKLYGNGWHRVWNRARSDGSGRSHPLFVAWLSWATLVECPIFYLLVEENPAIF